MKAKARSINAIKCSCEWEFFALIIINNNDTN